MANQRAVRTAVRDAVYCAECNRPARDNNLVEICYSYIIYNMEKTTVFSKTMVYHYITIRIKRIWMRSSLPRTRHVPVLEPVSGQELD